MICEYHLIELSYHYHIVHICCHVFAVVFCILEGIKPNIASVCENVDEFAYVMVGQLSFVVTEQTPMTMKEKQRRSFPYPISGNL